MSVHLHVIYDAIVHRASIATTHTHMHVHMNMHTHMHMHIHVYMHINVYMYMNNTERDTACIHAQVKNEINHVYT